MPQIVLIDNGSKRADATLSLRSLASRLEARVQAPVAPVSLLHSDAIAPEALDGRPAETFKPYLRRALQQGVREFLLIPLFFGPSRALTSFVPETAEALRAEFGDFSLRLAPELCPLPNGEPRLAEILFANLEACRAALGAHPDQVILVDHGSPIPQVTAVRHWLAGRLAERLSTHLSETLAVTEAAMERRPGKDYDFNGPLLSDALASIAHAKPSGSVAIAMQFLAAGRHAGPGGDVATICREAEERHPGLRIAISPLMGSHPLLIDILSDRLRAIEGAVPRG